MGQEDAENLLHKLEQENGGPIRFRTYCVLYGYSDGTWLNRGGLLYIVDDKLIFEDFESEPTGLGAFFRKKKEVFEKLKTYQLITDITGMRYVRSSPVKKLLPRKTPVKQLPELTKWKKILFQSLLEISFAHAPSWYAEILNDKQLITFIEETDKHESL